MINKELYWERRHNGERGANQGLEAHPNYVRRYKTIVTREITSKQPWENKLKHKFKTPKRCSKKDRRILKLV